MKITTRQMKAIVAHFEKENKTSVILNLESRSTESATQAPMLSFTWGGKEYRVDRQAKISTKEWVEV